METAIIGGAATITVALIGLISTIIVNRKKTAEALKTTVSETVSEAVKTATAETNKRVDTLQATLDLHMREGDEDKAKRKRDSILRFYDEICAHRDHSEPVWLGVLDEIDEYEAYCDTHPAFKNSRGKMAMKHIRETYDTLKSTGQFEIKE